MYKVLFNPLATWIGAGCLALSLVLPPDGMGITVCWFKWWFDLPCPGCGLTRSVTCISHLQFAKAVAYHPFGPLIYALFIANVVVLLLPRTWRAACQERLTANDLWLRRVYNIVIFSFLAYGGLRLLFNLIPTM